MSEAGASMRLRDRDGMGEAQGTEVDCMYEGQVFLNPVLFRNSKDMPEILI